VNPYMATGYNQRARAFMALLGGVLILGFAAIFVKWSEAPGPVTALYRMIIGSALITPVLLLKKRRKIRTLPKKGVLLAAIGGALFGCDMAIWMTAVDMGGATTPTLMANTAPLWVGLGSLLILRERQTAVFWVGLLIALSGTVIVLGHDVTGAEGPGAGAALGLVAAVFYASFYIATQEGRKHLDTISYLCISTVTAAVALLLINLFLRSPLSGFPGRTYLSFLALGVLVQFLGWLIINYAQGHIRASVVAPTLLGQPVLTAILAIPLLGETFTPRYVAGGLTVLAGIYTVVRSRNRMLRSEGGSP
jgi:drug/metabolite transporter (DMT)-like permease